MDLQPYVDRVRHELSIAARAGGDDAAALAERLSAPLESVIRLALLDALSTAAEEITRELAPGSVDVRLRGREPEFVVTAPMHPPADEPNQSADDPADDRTRAQPAEQDDGGTWRVTLRLPETLRPGVETAARRDAISVNAWLVRAAAAGVGAAPTPRTNTRHRMTGWVR